MKIIPIFVDREKLLEEHRFWTVVLDGEHEDEFAKAIGNFKNPYYLENYFEENKALLETAFWRRISPEVIIDFILDEVEQLEILLIDAENGKFAAEGIFQRLFSNPLYRLSIPFVVKGKSQHRPPIIRLYGVELEEGQIVITGGGIKLTRTYQQSSGLTEEVEKAKMVVDYLKRHQILVLNEEE